MKIKFFAVISIFILLLSSSIVSSDTTIIEPSISAGYNHSMGLNSYGRVYSGGDNTYGQCNTYGWKNIVGIAAGNCFSAGLLNDGTVITTGTGGSSDFTFDTSSWTNIIKIVAGNNFLAGLSSYGNVMVTGKTVYDKYEIETTGFSDISDIAAGDSHLIGIHLDGTCVGTGYTSPATVSEWTSVKKIFAGANVSVALLEDGTLKYAGFPYLVMTDEGSIWKGSEWTDISEVLLVKTDNGSTATVGIKNDGSYLLTAPEVNLMPDFSTVQNVKQTVIGRNANTIYSMILHNNNQITVLGLNYINNEHRNWLKNIDGWRLDTKPMSIKKTFPVMATGRYTMAFVLPSGKLRVLGNRSTKTLAGPMPTGNFSNIAFIDSTIYNKDTYIAIDDEENVLSNNTSYNFNNWNGVQKVSVTRLDDSYIAEGLKWDRRIYSTDDNDESFDYNDVVDIACGNYFSSVLLNNGKVNTKTYGAYLFETNEWSNIERIIPGFSHLIGIKPDKTVVVHGGGSSYSGHDVSSWGNIVDAAGGYNFTVGLKSDGTCVSVGKTGTYNIDISDWTNVKNIYSGYKYVIGYTNDGRFLFSGTDEGVNKDTVKNIILTESLFINTEKNASSTQKKLVLDFSNEGLDMDTSTIYVAVYKSDGSLMDVKVETYSNSVDSMQYIVDNLPEGASRWKLMVWNCLKPIYIAEGNI